MKAHIALTAICLTALLCGCTKQNRESLYATQEERIDSYINSLVESNPGYSVIRNNGSNRIIMQGGTGPALAPGGTVSFYYAGYTFTTNISASNLFATNSEAVATESGWSVSDADFSVKTVSLNDEDLIEGLVNGLEGVRAGEICLIVFSGKYGFGKRQIGTIPANSALAYQIWVESVSE